MVTSTDRILTTCEIRRESQKICRAVGSRKKGGQGMLSPHQPILVWIEECLGLIGTSPKKHFHLPTAWFLTKLFLVLKTHRTILNKIYIIHYKYLPNYYHKHQLWHLQSFGRKIKHCTLFITFLRKFCTWMCSNRP